MDNPMDSADGYIDQLSVLCEDFGCDPGVDRLRWLHERLSDANTLRELTRAIVDRVEWNGRRQGWDIRRDLPAGTISAARDYLAKHQPMEEKP